MSKEPRTMFSITAKDGEWPGLGKVAEECSEAIAKSRLERIDELLDRATMP